jgi:hypothetical protein
MWLSLSIDQQSVWLLRAAKKRRGSWEEPTEEKKRGVLKLRRKSTRICHMLLPTTHTQTINKTCVSRAALHSTTALAMPAAAAARSATATPLFFFLLLFQPLLAPTAGLATAVKANNSSSNDSSSSSGGGDRADTPPPPTLDVIVDGAFDALHALLPTLADAETFEIGSRLKQLHERLQQLPAAFGAELGDDGARAFRASELRALSCSPRYTHTDTQTKPPPPS